MIADSVQLAASTNLVHTYFQLGLATPKAEIWEESGFHACVGDLDHPICNFALKLRLDPWSARRLQAIASEHEAFHVYVLPGDSPEHVDELLERNGFRSIYRLTQMVAKPSSANSTSTVCEAVTRRDRWDVAHFMADQFFGRQSEDFRARVADATSLAADLSLYYLGEKPQRLGALMLCRDLGVVGLYNLCVSASKRGRGIGADLVRWVLAEASASASIVTLQCESHLEPWYEALGFTTTGIVQVYSLCRDGQGAIIGSI